MSFVAVETVGDEAAAQVLAEALAAAEIEVELRRLPGSPYGPARLEIEVRVAAADAPRARALLAQLADDAEAAVRAEAHLPAPTLPTRPRRQRSWSLSSEHQQTLYKVGAAITLALLTIWFLQRWCSILER